MDYSKTSHHPHMDSPKTPEHCPHTQRTPHISPSPVPCDFPSWLASCAPEEIPWERFIRTLPIRTLAHLWAVIVIVWDLQGKRWASFESLQRLSPQEFCAHPIWLAPVSKHTMFRFFELFGPLDSCIEKICALLGNKGFAGNMTQQEQEGTLGTMPPGSFIVRYSQSRSGCFVLTVAGQCKKDQVKTTTDCTRSTVILANATNGVSLVGSPQPRAWAHLGICLEQLEHEGFKPCCSSTVHELWERALRNAAMVTTPYGMGG